MTTTAALAKPRQRRKPAAPPAPTVASWIATQGYSNDWATPYATPESAWQHEDAYHLLLWAQLALPHRRRVVLAALAIAHTVQHYVPEPQRSEVRRHLAVSEAWCFGLATQDQARAAADACWKIRGEFWRAYYTATATATATAAAATATAYAAAYAADAAAAAAAATATDAWHANRTAARAWLSHAVRALLPWSRELGGADGAALDTAMLDGRWIECDPNGPQRGQVECAWLPITEDPARLAMLRDAPAWRETGAGWLYMAPVGVAIEHAMRGVK